MKQVHFPTPQIFNRYAMFCLRSPCLAVVLVGSFLTAMVGCGDSGSATTASNSASANQNGSAVAVSESRNSPTAKALPNVPPTDVVSQFLDLVRRGGQTEQAASLLTQTAQSELKRIGRSVQPIGSPDAQFEVTRFEIVPADLPTDEQAALVHSLWTEPGEQGVAEPIQVVWAAQVESGQWRISGLAMEIEAGQEPIVINFEDGNRMAAILAEAETEPATADTSDASPAASQAAQTPAGDAAIAR